MPTVVGITFRKIGKVYYFDPGRLDLQEGEFVITETANGLAFGEVVLTPRQITEEEVVAPLKKVVRVAVQDDLNREAANRDREKRGLEVCEQKISQHKLPMKLLDAECSFDGSMITFSFSAEGRIDFRELVKDVAGILKARVQLHQIGVRDEAKIIGGYGACGRPLCCATFLTSFEPVSMKMAKDQSLFLNPAKFSGCCGKLLCCLRYEQDFYKYAHERLPAVGAVLQVGEVRARVADVNVISDMLTLETEDGVQMHVNAADIALEGLCKKHGMACGMVDKNCKALSNDKKQAEPDSEPEVNDETEQSSLETTEAPEVPAQHSRTQQPQNLETVSGIRFRDVNADAKSAQPTIERRDKQPSPQTADSRQARPASRPAQAGQENQSKSKKNKHSANRNQKPGKPRPQPNQNPKENKPEGQ